MAPPKADDSHRGASQSHPNSVRERHWFRRDEADCRSDCGRHDYFYDPCPDSGACVLCAYERTSAAAWVRGNGADESLGLRAQQILGRLFSETFVATPESWDAATTLVRAPRSCNIPKLIWWRISGKVRRAKRKLASMVNNDLAAVNAIGIAVHNLVNSLRRMRALYSDANRRRTLSPEDAANQSLVAPASIFRQATVGGELNGNLFSNNSLFILYIGNAAKLEVATPLAFMRRSWSSCPAEQWVPAMLEGVWLRANAEN